MNKFLILLPLLLLSTFSNAQNGEIEILHQQKQQLTGVIKDLSTGNAIPNTRIQLFQKKELISDTKTGDDGSFTFSLEVNSSYLVSAKHENYTTSNKMVYTSTKGEAKDLEIKLLPVKEFIIVDTNKQIDVGHLSFEIDEAIVNPTTATQLEKVVNVMDKYTDIKVIINVHTDSKGKPEYSQKISEDRAATVLNYLVEKGIAAERLEAHGYGDTQLVNHCTKIVKCTELEHKMNRRIDFIAIE